MPFGFPKKPSRPTAKGVTESAAKKAAVAFFLSPVGLTILGIALVLGFVLITIVSIVGKASTDPIFAAQVGLDVFFGNHSQTPTPPPTTCTDPSTCSISPAPITGTPTGEPSNREVVYWSETITKSLSKKASNCVTFNVQTNPNICNASNKCATVVQNSGADCQGYAGYLCTLLVIDAYNLSGLYHNFSHYVLFMMLEWTKAPGYRLIPAAAGEPALSQVEPGDVIFMVTRDGSGHHVVIVEDKRVDQNGSGTINVLESNGYEPTDQYTVHDWMPYVSLDQDQDPVLTYGLGPRQTTQ